MVNLTYIPLHYSLKSSQGRQIEDATMSTVQKLMVDINHRAISKSEFQTLTNTLIDEEGLLVENWASIINQFTSTGRRLLAKQGRRSMKSSMSLNLK